jgi:hypothetical protein
MDRRTLLTQGAALTVATAAQAAQPLRPNSAVQAIPPVNRPIFPRACAVRPNINSLSAAQLSALKTGVQVMMGRPASDPTSWTYQAAMHATYATPVQPLWNGCQHGTIHFLSWHRLFIYYFERILRKASGSPGLMLPYWDWTANRAMPAPFTDSTPGNPLYTAHRGAGINTGSPLPTSAVNYSAAIGDFPYSAFSSDLVGTPHGAVHVAIGGWMSQIPQAAQDPIFWLHHCNIDRLWDVWLRSGGGRADPTTAAWLSQTFSYYDENGTEHTDPMSRAVDPCASLGYSYTSRFILKPFPWPLINLLDELRAAEIRAAADAPAARAELGDAPAQLKLPLPAQTATAAQALFLVFDEIAVDNPEGYYELYFDLPEGRPPDPAGPNYAGNLVLFGLTERELAVKHGDMRMPPPRRVFDVTRKLAQLRQANGFNPQALMLTLLLRTTEGAKPEPGVRARIGKVQLVAR